VRRQKPPGNRYEIALANSVGRREIAWVRDLKKTPRNASFRIREVYSSTGLKGHNKSAQGTAKRQ
jgi:hypothetical protein